MRKLILSVLAITLVCGASVFTSCTTRNENPVVPVPVTPIVSENIVGKWMLSDLNGELCPTNLKTVVTFVSPTKVIGSLSDYYTEAWNVLTESDVTITDGNKLHSVYEVGSLSSVVDCTVLSISDDELIWSSDWTTYLEGKQISHESYTKERYLRVKDDFKDAIVGTWEGKSSDPADLNGDPTTHRWEYRADGTYVYYNKVDGKWVAQDDVLAEYFVDGVLLCTRWKKAAGDKEQREWWEIQYIRDDTMAWSAIRLSEDGKYSVELFVLNKVD